ncbi:MAG TPA: ABC transporter permease [Gordonia sp. (in: high G+C Gram-positive bacteria)]|uniref:MlaE family ABC transporter permease n=1 Tax=unclassified Gordonia (in: high G+C Gram-positive bacteria) TaxID=2657482 RepID=UPI000FA9E28A|nr:MULTISPECIES: ABC transporter permease [unclassified Gordonia (in: high G+C Gram-positive bacteria)]RUP39647.1 MAG: ABC transporter permease [Gordonia sp. (in: high G+C Gram-positive bacteria)]HNP56914.1 ABC transporter permease [Gordonia sp. (in: high G+C Gram-positive bacteria)]HRC51165.1 ABC transporter permease [Gordonia sp. (in: high G+C Gram-positive bacteria)]
MTALTAETDSIGPSTRAIFSDNLRDNARGPLRTLGRTFQLAVQGVAQMLLDIGRWQLKVKETLIQAWYLVSVTALPAFLMAIPFGVIVTIQIGNVINQLGAQSLLGAGSGFAVIQQAAPLASGMLLGGAGASAIAADLGARNVREEIDAMRTMGIDPIQRLVVPRIIASVVVAPLLALFIILVGVVAAYYVAVLGQDVGAGSYWQSFGAFASVRDVGLAMLKAVIFGFMIAVIGCQRGLEAKGGPKGVADGVNATVVVSTVAIIIVNMLITLIYTVFFPMQLG